MVKSVLHETFKNDEFLMVFILTFLVRVTLVLILSHLGMLYVSDDDNDDDHTYHNHHDYLKAKASCRRPPPKKKEQM